MKLFYTFLLFLFTSQLVEAQLSGLISNTEGEVLPFATIFIDGTSIGTTSNIDGEFKLALNQGDYVVIFQYVGYKQTKKKISIENDEVRLEIAMEKDIVNLDEVVISANGEDPAYPIIRKAISKRKYYKDLVKSFTSKAYTKGNIRFLEAPEKILGQEIGDLGGILDSARTGIVYLSEAESNIYFQSPNNFKEVMISSIVSGDDQGFSFNEAGPLDFILYKNFVELGNRQIASPISENAFFYYRYKLLGSFLDEQGHFINKIQVLPKNEFGPAFFGVIYITEDLWNIQSTDLYLTGRASKFPIMDTLALRQVYIPIEGPDKWMLFSQSINFTGGAFSFKLAGDFASIFSEYDLNPKIEDSFFSNEIFKVEEGANKKDSSYWEEVRPVPLTTSEKKDYVKKDSLQEVWKSKAFLDSIDHVNNKFTVGNLLFGYSYDRSYKKRHFSFQSPLSTVQFNTIQGYTANLNFAFRQEFDEERKSFSIRPELQYGFSDKIFRANATVSLFLSQKKRQNISLSGGRQMAQFNMNSPVDVTLNTFYSLFSRENYFKAFDKYFARLSYTHEVANGLFIRTFLEYAGRHPLLNSSSHSLFKKDKSYFSNDPLDPTNFEPSFESHQAMVLNVNLRIRFGQKFMTYPDRKFRISSSWPDLYINYRKGIEAFGSDVDFDKLSISIRKNRFNIGILGASGFNVVSSFVLNDNKMPFIDYYHHMGNQFIFTNASRYLYGFKKMPYYVYSTNKWHGKAFYEHHFEGFILDKIPLIKYLGAKSVFGFAGLYENEEINYYELSAGIEGLGFGIFKLFRVDYVWSFDHTGLQDHGVIIAVGTNF
jgi:hypothetical protein